MIHRIELILKTQNLSPTQFADAIGIQRPTMSHILARRNNPSLDFVTKVLNRFPEINSEWLLTGKGQMLKLGTTLPASGTSTQTSINSKNPEFAWKDELSAASTTEQKKFATPQQFSSRTNSETPPYQSVLTIEEEEKTPQAPSQEKIYNSDIERIIVFFTDGTFRAYVGC